MGSARAVSATGGRAELVDSFGSAGEDIDWSVCDVAALNSFVAERSAGYSPASCTAIVDATRSLMRWALACGRVDRDLTGGILRTRSTRATLPRGLSPAQVEALLGACSTRATTGVRDRAVITVLWPLGLRAGEAAGLGIDDIDWVAGRSTVLGKGQRRLRLPLTVDVGQVLVTWLGLRPTDATDRALFVRLRPPIRALTSAGISDIVKHRAEAAGLGVVHAHRLRHTAAMKRHRERRGAGRRSGTPRTPKRDQYPGLRKDRPLVIADTDCAVRAGATMSLHTDLDVYLTQRRELGFELKTSEYLLRQFCGWLEERGKIATFTIDDAVGWTRDRPGAAPVWWSQRLTAVRPFAAWLNARDTDVPIIPGGLLPVRTTRRNPFIYSQADVGQFG